jgi:hypothetical protein
MTGLGRSLAQEILLVVDDRVGMVLLGEALSVIKA